MKVKTKDLVKTVDTKAIKDRADCFQRGDEWYEAEPAWDRREVKMRYFSLEGMRDGEVLRKDEQGRYYSVDGFNYYKEFEVTESGSLVGYVKSGSVIVTSNSSPARAEEIAFGFSIGVALGIIVAYALALAL